MSDKTELAAIAEAQALRTDALDLVRTDIARLNAALAEKPVAARLRDDAMNHAADALGRAGSIAMDNKPVLAATGLALIGWTFRHQLGALTQRIRRA